MSETVKFNIFVATKYVGSKDTKTIAIDREDLEGIPEDEWEDFVWETLGAREDAIDMCEMGIRRLQEK